ncbi:hypothetical protein GGI16_000379 [Coemansia sp. S142-1]|nr:hypothetical protein GGI16_000379 [Coemansia sp. S142-1]
MNSNTFISQAEYSRQQVIDMLANKFENRPTHKELEERNIFSKPKVSPFLQDRYLELRRSLLKINRKRKLVSRQAREEYQKSITKSRLENFLGNRLPREEFERSLTRSHLERFLEKRLTHKDLASQSILNSTTFASSLQARQAELKRGLLENHLKHKLENRQPHEEFERSLTRGLLERFLKKRPAREELVSQRVLYNTTTVPTFYERQLELRRNQQEMGRRLTEMARAGIYP